jgi:pantoate--beta-alanine ligase
LTATARRIDEVRLSVREAKSSGKRIGFVPTMGSLHDGHLALLDAARAAGCDFLVVSIFVNPKQFGPNEDFARYPRDEHGDLAQLRSRGVDLLFAPSVEEIYPPHFQTSVRVSGVARALEGERRPGHFDGVATIVCKLFNIVQPDVAVFGEKDAQQCAVISRMVKDLAIPVELRFHPTVRESDGLARSSRNVYLDPRERSIAPAMHEAITLGASKLRGGASVKEAEDAMAARIREESALSLDYLRVVDPNTFETPSDDVNEVAIVGAVRIGSTRLIDTMTLTRGARS